MSSLRTKALPEDSTNNRGLDYYRKRAEYCFESTVSDKRTHWASLSFGANSVSSVKNSVSSLLHTNNRLRGTHWVRSPELSEGKKTHWVRCLKPYSLKPYSARFRYYDWWAGFTRKRSGSKEANPPTNTPKHKRIRWLLDATSDASLSWKVMVVVVFGPSLT